MIYVLAFYRKVTDTFAFYDHPYTDKDEAQRHADTINKDSLTYNVKVIAFKRA